MASSEADRKAVVKRMNDEVWGEGNTDLIDEYVAEDYVEHNTASPEEIRGQAGYKANVEQFHAGFSGVEVTTDHVFAEGPKVVNHYTIQATHDGPFMDLEPTGEAVSVSGIAIARFEDGLIAEDWSQIDVVGLLGQLGVMDL